MFVYWNATSETRSAISELPSASVSKRVQMQNLSYENEFDLHLNGLVSKTDFHMKGFALGLVLKQRQRELGNGLLRHQSRTIPLRTRIDWIGN